MELLLSCKSHEWAQRQEEVEEVRGVNYKHLRFWRLQTDLLVSSNTPKGFLYSEGCHSMSTPSSVAPPHSLLALKLTDCGKLLDDIAFPGNTWGDSKGVLWMLPELQEHEVY